MPAYRVHHGWPRSAGEDLSPADAKAEAVRKQAERVSARNERARDSAMAVVDEEIRQKAIAARTIRLRQERLARDSAQSEAAAAATAVPAKRAGRKTATAAHG